MGVDSLARNEGNFKPAADRLRIVIDILVLTRGPRTSIVVIDGSTVQGGKDLPGYSVSTHEVRLTTEQQERYSHFVSSFGASEHWRKLWDEFIAEIRAGTIDPTDITASVFSLSWSISSRTKVLSTLMLTTAHSTAPSMSQSSFSGARPS